jgi:hypothetical protein
MWIQGKVLREKYPQLTGNELFEWCKAGRLKPFRRCSAFCGRDPKSPRGWRRVFPTEEADRKYDSLCGKYLSLIGWLKSRRVPHEKVIEADQDGLTLSLKKSGRPIELPEIEQFKYNLFRRRQTETAEILRLLSEIEELEKELKPGKVWGNPCLVFADVLTLLMDSFFRSEDKFLSSTTPEHITPEREKTGISQKKPRF